MYKFSIDQVLYVLAHIFTGLKQIRFVGFSDWSFDVSILLKSRATFARTTRTIHLLLVFLIKNKPYSYSVKRTNSFLRTGTDSRFKGTRNGTDFR